MSRDAHTRDRRDQPAQAGRRDPGTETAPGTETEQDKAAFTSYYLQRATREFAEDLDAVRAADDFSTSSSSSTGGGGAGKGAGAENALRTLVGSLAQGVEMFAPAERRRVVRAGGAAGGEGEAGRG